MFMAGKQAKILTKQQLRIALRRVRANRYPERDRVVLLLSSKAGLRAGEIAKLTWTMVLSSDRRLADRIELHDAAAKKGSGRSVPMHPQIRTALVRLRRISDDGFIIQSERSGGMQPGSLVNWFRGLYRELGFAGCSSHSGRRTFITHAARLVSRAGGSLRDVQQLAGHRSIEQTQAYIDGDSAAQRRLVTLL
jgi:integrase/recombinase XerD